MKSKFIYGKKVQEIFKLAKEKKFALPAINVSGTNTINAVLETASEINSPVIKRMNNFFLLFKTLKKKFHREKKVKITAKTKNVHTAR